LTPSAVVIIGVGSEAALSALSRPKKVQPMNGRQRRRSPRFI